jgi:sugar phosphate permease
MSTDPPVTDDRPTNVRWLVLILACGTSWFLYLHRYTWNFILPELKREYGVNNTQGGTLGGLFYVTYGIGQIPSGVVCDLIGPHLFLGITIPTFSLVLACFALVQNYPTFVALRLVFGAAQAGAYPALGKVTYSWFPLRTRTTIQAWIASFSGRAGGAMSSLIMATLLMAYCGLTWRAAIVVMGLVGLLFGIAFIVLFRDSPETDARVNTAERLLIQGDSPTAPRPRSDAPRVLPWRNLVRSRTMWVLLVEEFTYAGSDVAYVLFMGDYFLNERGFPESTAGLLVSLPFWGGALGGVVGGMLNDVLAASWGSRRWARSSVGFTGKILACVFIFVAIGQRNGVAAAIALFFAKFFTDWGQPTVWGTCSDLGGRHYTATVFSTVNMAGNIAAIIMARVFGQILDFAGYSTFFMTIAIMYIISALSWFWIDCTKPIVDEGEPTTADRV